MGLFLCAASAWAQAPAAEETRAMIETSRHTALAYSQSLPDFVCTQLVHRFVDTTRRGLWRVLDNLSIKLSYFEQMEDHKLVTVDGKPTGKLYSDLDGAVTVGEFGSVLRQIFDPASRAVFTWEKWGKFNKRSTAVFLYRVDMSNSTYSLAFRVPMGLNRAKVAYSGIVEVDRETGDVLHLTYAAEGIPKSYPIQLAKTTVKYGFADVGGKEYLLPVASETEMRSRDLWARNSVEFREYRKYSADSTISFGDGK